MAAFAQASDAEQAVNPRLASLAGFPDLDRGDVLHAKGDFSGAAALAEPVGGSGATFSAAIRAASA